MKAAVQYWLKIILLQAAVILTVSFLIGTEADYIKSRPEKGFFSPAYRREKILPEEGRSHYRLRERNIIGNSESVYQGEQRLVKGRHYSIDYIEGLLTLKSKAEGLIDQTKAISIEYLIIPKSISASFSLFESVDSKDTTAVRKIESRSLTFALPDTDLDISGSKTFGVSLGSDEDFRINQTLFLRIDGELRRNLWIQAQLSDSHSPLTPEGDTRELSSLDQIFIRIFGRIPRNAQNNSQELSDKETETQRQNAYSRYEIAFGDLEMRFDDTQFIDYHTKFEGVKVEWMGINEIKAALALSKGKQETTEFNGVDGKQGPYYLGLEQAGTYVQVVPGSEEVFLDGILLERGTDYRINYSEGSITFTGRHFIDSNSRVYVRFQYSDEEYRQYKYMTGNRVELSDRLTIGFHLIHETDDKDNPLAGDFTEQEIEILNQAGDEPAWTDGVNKVEMGEGEYIRKVADDEEIYYEYVGPNEGDYIIHFSFVGEGKGSYQRIAPGHFLFVGEKEGNWIPERRLPSPESRSNYDIGLRYKSDNWQIDAEGIYTYRDRNIFSDLHSRDNEGYGTHWQLSLTPDYDLVNSDIRVYYRFLSKYLDTFTDITEPEIYHGISRRTEIDTVDVSEFGSTIRLERPGDWNSSIRFFRRSGNNDENSRSFFNDNLLFRIFLSPWSYVPQINYRYHYYHNRVSYSPKHEEISVPIKDSYKNDKNTAENDDREKEIEDAATQHNHFINLTKIVGKLRFSGDLTQRTYIEETTSKNEEAGDRFRSKRLDISSYRTQRLAGNVFFTLDKNFDYTETWDKQRESLTIGKESMFGVYDQNLKASYSHRQVTTYPEKAEKSYDMAEISLNSSLFGRGVNTIANYSLVNTEFYPKARRLIFVGRSQGIYDSTGVATEDGEYDYITVPVGDPEMSIEVNANLNFYVTPRQFIDQSSDDESGFLPFAGDILRRIQTESTILAAENSRSTDKWDVYLLKRSALMDEDNTIYGRSLYRHTVWVDLITRRLTGKLMFQENKTLDNRYDETVDSYTSINEVMLRLTRFLYSDFEIAYELRDEKESRYLSEIRVDSYKLDIRNRINRNLNLATMLQYSFEEGGEQGGERIYEMHSFSIAETVSYFFADKYRFFGRLEYRYNRREGTGFLTFLPEKRGGSVFRWNTRLNYQLNRYTAATFTYNGNKYPLQDTVHTIKIEFRAEF